MSSGTHNDNGPDPDFRSPAGDPEPPDGPIFEGSAVDDPVLNGPVFYRSAGHSSGAERLVEEREQWSGEPSLVPPLDSHEQVQRELEAFDAAVREQRQAHLNHLGRILAADRAELWFADGCPSMADWLVARYRQTAFAARSEVKVARALPNLPEIRSAYGSGWLSWAQLRALVDVATPDTDAELAVRAGGWTPSEIKGMRRSVSDETVEQAHADRNLQYWFHEREPMFEMHVTLPDDEGARLMTALKRSASVVDADPISGLSYHHGVRMADALVRMASHVLATDPDHDRATLVVHTDVAALLNLREKDAIGPIGQATLAEGAGVPPGTTIPNATLQRLACDARIQLALRDPKEGVVGVGRTTRTIPPWLARVVRARDGGCRFPDCPRTMWVEAHHIVHWADGGPTDLANLITLCGFHHRLIHHEGWTILGNPNGPVRWLTKWGHRFSRHPHREMMRQIRICHAHPNPVLPPDRAPPRVV